MIKRLFIFTLFALTSLHSYGQIRNGIRDQDGRHVVPRGFVVVTSTAGHDLMFDADDFQRMVRLGANAQVIRLELKKLSTFEGCQVDDAYLEKLDKIVKLAKNAGITTVFKMTNYGMKGSFIWEEFWANENNEHATYLEAWKVIWNRYADEPSVYGYDLVNEPRKFTYPGSYDDLMKNNLIPLYQYLIDEHNKINPSKMCLIQAIFQNKGHITNDSQYTEIKHPINRENIVYAPHFYRNEKDAISAEMERTKKEGELLNAPIFPGEWGFPTYFDGTDNSLNGELGQLNYTDYYTHMVQEMDRYGMGAIKAWFLGSKTFQDFLPEGPSTWAIFTDDKLNGTAERKYITDAIARPYPQSIAGDILSFFFDDATRTLDLKITSDNDKGASRIFVGANRHYPDGFTIAINDSFILTYNPLKTTGLDVMKADNDSNPADFIWDSARQKLIVLKWPLDKSELNVRITPGVNNVR